MGWLTCKCTKSGRRLVPYTVHDLDNFLEVIPSGFGNAKICQ